MSERKLIIEVARKRYPEQLHQEDLLPHEPHIILALSSASTDISGYRFSLGSINPFYYDSKDPMTFYTSDLCTEPSDFPQLRHRTFEAGLQSLVNELVGKNPGLVVDFLPSVRSSVDGYKIVEEVIMPIPQFLLDEEERREFLSRLSLVGQHNLANLRPQVIEDVVASMDPRTLYGIIQLGTHSWRLLREFGNVFCNTGYKLGDLLKEQE